MQLSRRDFLKGAVLTTAGGAVLATSLSSAIGANVAFADPVGSGSIGLSFDESKWALGDQSVSGQVCSYDIDGTDAFNLTFDYDSVVFSKVELSAPMGTTILDQNDNGAQLQVVFIVDPSVVDYENLLTVTVTGASDNGDDFIDLSAARAAKLGGTMELAIIGGDNNTGVRIGDPISEFTIEMLSLATTFNMVDKTSPRWPDAVCFDMNADGLIDTQDFVRIANGILDAANNTRLRFNADGTFKILQVSDYQDYIDSSTRPNVHARSVALFNAMLDAENPDLVVMTGDMIGGDMSADLLQDYIGQMMAPCEERKIPWLVTYGNHDEDAVAALDLGWDKIRELDYYRSFPYNINRPTMSTCIERVGANTNCVGDMYLFLYDAEGDTPIYNIWALDSNRYQIMDITRPLVYEDYFQDGSWDWLRANQVAWYARTSQRIKEYYGTLNSLLFMHIPVQEYSNMYSEASKFDVVGLRGEGECPGNLNSGLFAAVHERGDVRGIFVGHDHLNDYIGNYYGIYLAYDASIGYATYGDEMKGGRVIELNKSDLSTFKTKMIYASDYGLSQ